MQVLSFTSPSAVLAPLPHHIPLQTHPIRLACPGQEPIPSSTPPCHHLWVYLAYTKAPLNWFPSHHSKQAQLAGYGAPPQCLHLRGPAPPTSASTAVPAGPGSQPHAPASIKQSQPSHNKQVHKACKHPQQNQQQIGGCRRMAQQSGRQSRSHPIRAAH